MEEYKRNVDSIRAPEALIAATLNRIHEEESKEITAGSRQPAVVKPFKPRRRWGSIAAVAAAAVLVLVAGLNRNTSRMELTYGTIPDTIVRSNLPAANTQQMELTEYSERIGMDVESLIPNEGIVKADIQVVMEQDILLSDECTVTYNAEGKPLMLRLSGTQDILPKELSQVTPSDVDGLTVYAAASASGKSRMAGFRLDGFSFFLTGTNMEQAQFEALLNDLIQNIQK